MESASATALITLRGLRRPAFSGFDDGARVVRDQPAEHGFGVLGVAQVPGAVEGMRAGGDQAGGVADVVQPGSGR